MNRIVSGYARGTRLAMVELRWGRECLPTDVAFAKAVSHWVLKAVSACACSRAHCTHCIRSRTTFSERIKSFIVGFCGTARWETMAQTSQEFCVPHDFAAQ